MSEPYTHYHKDGSTWATGEVNTVTAFKNNWKGGEER